MNTNSVLYGKYCWIDGLGLSIHCCHMSITVQKHPGEKSQNTYLSVYNNATALAKYILYISLISILPTKDVRFHFQIQSR